MNKQSKTTLELSKQTHSCCCIKQHVVYGSFYDKPIQGFMKTISI
ncbi:unnamed protein product [Paramecium sonneborni]|uniref:Uncharacterized protein n=1 Tax=Paramecium sonneborni TaxID=65129 RepID=A0A8S1Q114_9CILI|nr:unnamed protein product [Paramecium sonneborni]